MDQQDLAAVRTMHGVPEDWPVMYDPTQENWRAVTQEDFDRLLSLATEKRRAET